MTVDDSVVGDVAVDDYVSSVAVGDEAASYGAASWK